MLKDAFLSTKAIKKILSIPDILFLFGMQLLARPVTRTWLSVSSGDTPWAGFGRQGFSDSSHSIPYMYNPRNCIVLKCTIYLYNRLF